MKTGTYNGDGIANQPATIASNVIKTNAQETINKIGENVKNKKIMTFKEFLAFVPID